MLKRSGFRTPGRERKNSPGDRGPQPTWPAPAWVGGPEARPHLLSPVTPLTACASPPGAASRLRRQREPEVVGGGGDGARALALPIVPSRRFALARRGRGGGGGVSCGRRVRGAGREGEGGVGMDQAPRLLLREPALEPEPRRWRRRRLSVVSPTVSDWPRPWVGTGGLPGAAAGPPRGLEPVGPFAAPVAPKPRASGWTSRRRASCLSLGHPPPPFPALSPAPPSD